MLNWRGRPVTKGRDLLKSLWYKNWWLKSGERICWKIATCNFMWMLDRVIGHLIFMIICLLVYTYPYCIVCLGPSDARYRFWKWIGSCVWCGKKKISPQGIVLHQFLTLLRRLPGMSDGSLWQLLSQGNIIYISSKLAHVWIWQLYLQLWKWCF